ncbi:hypothetical protein AAII07_50955 [Microvirga sp. 0TCS3.31]
MRDPDARWARPTPMHRTTLTLVSTTLAAVMLLGACGTQDGSGRASGTDPDGTTPGRSAPTTTPTSTPTTPPSTPPSTTPTDQPTTPPSGQLEKVRVVGRVTGVGDCVVVRDDNGTTWTVTGPLASDLVLRDRVQVTGTPDLTAMGCAGPVVQAVRASVLPPAG